jgi:uncharacterized protein YbjT (DUF2867 family)
MPVLVTVAASALGRDLIRRIAGVGGQVRAFCDPADPVAELRHAGAICAVGSLLDEGHLETAMEQVHTVVHLGVGPLAGDPGLMVEEAATVLTAAVGAGVRRLIVASVTASAHDAADAVRRGAAEVEEMARSFPAPTVIVRSSFVDTGPLRAAVARTPLGSDILAAPVAPVTASEVGGLLFAIDEARDEPDRGAAVVVAADGALRLPLGEHLRACGVTPMSVLGRAVERFRALGAGGLLADYLAGPLVADLDVPSGWDAFAVSRRGGTPEGDGPSPRNTGR